MIIRSGSTLAHWALMGLGFYLVSAASGASGMLRKLIYRFGSEARLRFDVK